MWGITYAMRMPMTIPPSTNSLLNLFAEPGIVERHTQDYQEE